MWTCSDIVQYKKSMNVSRRDIIYSLHLVLHSVVLKKTVDILEKHLCKQDILMLRVCNRVLQIRGLIKKNSQRMSNYSTLFVVLIMKWFFSTNHPKILSNLFDQVLFYFISVSMFPEKASYPERRAPFPSLCPPWFLRV